MPLEVLADFLLFKLNRHKSLEYVEVRPRAITMLMWWRGGGGGVSCCNVADATGMRCECVCAGVGAAWS